MAKVLLVEDDNNLREIYQARLLAEGYDIVAAQNGEEALVVAKQNKPDLIISDVMMPRISGFEMLDILRNTEGLKQTKVIMLTALGQTEDQKRADNLGADKYLVKSQVTLEDIVNAAKELLTEDGAITDVPPPPDATADAATAEPATVETPVPVAMEPPEQTPAPVPAPVAEPVATPTPIVAATSAPVTPEPTAAVTTTPVPVATAPVAAPAVSPVAPVATPDPTTAEPAVAPVTAASTPAAAPANDPAASASAAVTDAAAQTMAAEEKALEDQIATYAKEPGVDPPVVEPTPASTEASNAAAITAAVNELNTSTTPEPIQPPSVINAPAANPEPDTPVAPTAVTPEPPTTAAPAPVDATPVAASTTPAPAPAGDNNVTVAGKKIIQPISDQTPKPNLDELLAKEEANSPTPAPAPTPVAPNPGTPAIPPMPAHTPGQSFDPTKAL